MTQVWRNEEHSMPTLITAIGKLRQIRTQVGGEPAILGDLTLEELDTVIDHCESTKGQFQLPDVPM